MANDGRTPSEENRYPSKRQRLDQDSSADTAPAPGSVLQDVTSTRGNLQLQLGQTTDQFDGTTVNTSASNSTVADATASGNMASYITASNIILQDGTVSNAVAILSGRMPPAHVQSNNAVVVFSGPVVPLEHLRPINDLAGLLELPAEILREIYASRAGPQAAAVLRLLTPGTPFMEWNGPTIQYLTNVFTLIPSHHGFQRLIDIAFNWTGHPTSTWVKTIVYEDLVPRRFSNETFDIAVENGAEGAHLYTTYRAKTRDSHRDMVNRLTKRAIRRLTHLDTMEYSPGSHETRQPFSSPGRRFQDILEGAADSCLSGGDSCYKMNRLMARYMWQNRFDILIPAEEAVDWDTGLCQFHLLVREALFSRRRQAPLTVKIVTRHNDAFSDPPANEHLPMDNLLHHLDVQYIGLNMTDLYAIEDDLDILCDRDTSTAMQFSNLRSLRLAGASLFRGGLLNLQFLGQDYTPRWPHLRRLEFSNVIIGEDTARRMKKLPVHLKLHNIYWEPSAFPKTANRPRLLSVSPTGVHTFFSMTVQRQRKDGILGTAHAST